MEGNLKTYETVEFSLKTYETQVRVKFKNLWNILH